MDKIVSKAMPQELLPISEVKMPPLVLNVTKRGINSTHILNKSNSFSTELVTLMNRKNQIKTNMKNCKLKTLSIKSKKESKCWSKPTKKRNTSSKKYLRF